MPVPDPGSIRNYDCMYLINKIDRILLETKKSVSSGLNDYREPDKIRLQSYIDSLTAWLDYSSKQPPMDKPHSHPLLHNVKAPPVAIGGDGVDIDNEGARALLHELGTFRINVQMCQSADLPNNYMSHDLARFRSYTQQIQNLLNEFIDKVQPLDLPETSSHGK